MLYFLGKILFVYKAIGVSKIDFVTFLDNLHKIYDNSKGIPSNFFTRLNSKFYVNHLNSI